MTAPSRHYHRLAWAAVLLALTVIVFGGFVRLSNAGLSCPDWPTCYGKATWPTHAEQVAGHAATEIRPVEPGKAWLEQFHRHIAASLGLLVFALALLAVRRRRYGLAQVIGAAALVAIAIPLYMQGQHVASSVLVAIAEAALLWAALRWSNVDLARTATLTLAVIIFQALLGMWTVTLLLKPAIVTAHLLGGMTILSLLSLLALRLFAPGNRRSLRLERDHRLLAGLALVAVLLQIALGGWVSSNYAALVCPDFPTCRQSWLPAMQFGDAFHVFRELGMTANGLLLSQENLVAIHWSHRLGALLVTLLAGPLAWRLWQEPEARGYGVLLGCALLLQLALGIANVLLQLPLSLAVAHNGGAALLLLSLVWVNYRVWKGGSQTWQAA